MAKRGNTVVRWGFSETFHVSRTQICVRQKCCVCGKMSQHLGNMITSAMLPPQCVLILPAPKAGTSIPFSCFFCSAFKRSSFAFSQYFSSSSPRRKKKYKNQIHLWRLNYEQEMSCWTFQCVWYGWKFLRAIVGQSYSCRPPIEMFSMVTQYHSLQCWRLP